MDILAIFERGQWLRATVLGANDGLVSVASLMMGVGAVKQHAKAMIFTGFAGLVAGACSMAIGEFVSVYSQLDIEVAQMKREKRMVGNQQEKEREQLPNPMQAALAFSLGAIIRLLAASFIADHKARLGVVVAAVSLTLVIFGWIGSVLGGVGVCKHLNLELLALQTPINLKVLLFISEEDEQLTFAKRPSTEKQQLPPSAATADSYLRYRMAAPAAYF
ncbi:hypothetical protein L1987_19934 [Smallanthus sonchifolius]|uniref:Uncharacterized protein n=1 Tax=Smallanthus sonchifolius TaxID=185202 RepID=A0ACB9IQE7_9ASTR|nr:hypothetical protein L1987_19934 [Smallanthus sonchifolius]